MGIFTRSYLVCATQRSGSTLLCELLKDTGVAGRPEEYFEANRETGIPPHPRDFLGALPPTGLGIRDDPTPPEAPAYSDLRGLESYREHLERTFAAGTTPNGVFGAKLMFNQLPDLETLAGQLPEYAGHAGAALLRALFGDPAYVWVSRRDKVRQAVSLWRALQSRRWRSGGGRGGEASYHFEAIDHLVRRIAAEDEGWQRFFHRHGLSPLRLVYEDDIAGDRRGAVAAVAARVGIMLPARWGPGEPTARQADDQSEEWVAAYHRDRAQRGTGVDRSGDASLAAR